MYGMGDFDLTKNQILYSLEFAQAIKHAENIGAAIEYIDESPSDLKEMIHQETPNIAKVAQSRFRLYHHRFRSSPSFLGEAMYQLLSFWIFRAKPILKYIEEDYVGIGELKTHLELWSRFHPAAYYWSLGLRDAVMTERIRMSVMDIRVNEALSHLDPNTIVVVVGKSHYFGIKYLWESFVEGNPPYARPQHS
jgi:pheromone shutdown protein TraB